MRARRERGGEREWREQERDRQRERERETDRQYNIQYNTVQLYCLYVEKFAFWLVIYIKTFNTVNNKTSTTQ